MIHLIDPTSVDRARRGLAPPNVRDMRRRGNESHYKIGEYESTEMGNTDVRQMSSCILIAVGNEHPCTHGIAPLGKREGSERGRELAGGTNVNELCGGALTN